MKTKICTNCKEEKPVSEFSSNKSRKDGLHHWCRPCDNARGAKYLKTERGAENQRKRHRRTYWRNKENNPNFINDRYEKEKDRVATRYSTYKKNAKTKDLEFAITKEQFKEITDQKCRYCNEYSEGKNFVGVDRIDSEVGYVVENCVPCCKDCNYSKRQKTPEAFLDKVKKIYEHSIKS
jgi:hypothetical protein